MHIPELPPLTPRRGNAITRSIGRLFLICCRWQIVGEVHNAEKVLIVLAPHTSAWDFFTAVASMLAMGFKASWLIAKGYMWWPLGPLIHWLGGIPVNQRSTSDLVSQLVNAFNQHDQLVLALFPEGTRRKVSKWKSGFWHVAVHAGLKIQLVSLDYKRRVAEFGPVISPSENFDDDMARIQQHYQNVTGKRPDKFGGEYLANDEV